MSRAKSNSKRLNVFGIIFSYMFPFIMLLGYSYDTTGSAAGLFSWGIWSIILIATITLIVGYCLQLLVFVSVSKIGKISFSIVRSYSDYGKYRVISCVVILWGWLPIVIANLPGAVPYDGMTQLLEHFGRIPHYGHHPVFITRLYGFIAQFGSYVWNDDFGVFLVVVFQIAICLAVFSEVCVYLLRTTGAFVLWLIMTFIYALFPVFSSYACAVMKDTFYMAVGTWFILELCKLLDRYLENGAVFSDKKEMLTLIAAGILMCLSRKEAFIIVFMTLLAAIIMLGYKNRKNVAKPIIVVLVSILAFWYSFNFVVHTVIGVPKGEISEALSIPFQQTARYVTLYPDEVTDEEKNAIDLVLPYEKIMESYNPELSDPIKGKMKSEVGMKGYITYAITWFKMGLKRPGIYLDATLNNTYGYFYPLYHSNSILQGGIEHSQTKRWGSEELDIYFLLEGTSYRDCILSLQETLTRLPIIRLTFSTGIYFWILVFLLTYCIQENNNLGIILLICPIMTYLVCFASPANGYARYILLVYSSIIMICVKIIMFNMRGTTNEL